MKRLKRTKDITIIRTTMRFFGLLTALLFVITLSAPAAFADDVSMDATAGDSVGTSYEISETLAVLGIVNSTNLSIHLEGEWRADQPGGQAEIDKTPNYSGGYASTRPRLHYTLHGLGNHKITVESTADLPDQCFGVGIEGDFGYSITSSGSAVETLGEEVDWGGPRQYYKQFPRAGSGALDLVVGISGSNTWTGTGENDGVPIEYALYCDPGEVSTVNLTYTLTSE
ncbi:MAG: hypothetical protein K9L29_08895 [Spirochaetales bacterium]|nr:hypothetical protein [Spirochaetales bacterium]